MFQFCHTYLEVLQISIIRKYDKNNIDLPSGKMDMIFCFFHRKAFKPKPPSIYDMYSISKAAEGVTFTLLKC